VHDLGVKVLHREILHGIELWTMLDLAAPVALHSGADFHTVRSSPEWEDTVAETACGHRWPSLDTSAAADGSREHEHVCRRASLEHRCHECDCGATQLRTLPYQLARGPLPQVSSASVLTTAPTLAPRPAA
jgi:hypothetical protein